MRLRIVWVVTALLSCSVLAGESTLKGVVLLPPSVTVTVTKKAGFVGVETKKSVERFDAPAHARLVKAFNAKLDGKVLPADVVSGVLSRTGVTGPAALDKPGVFEKVAAAANVDWVISFEIDKSKMLIAHLREASGREVGSPTVVSGGSALTDAQAEAMAGLLVPRLLAAEKARLEAIAAAQKAIEDAKPPPPPEQYVDPELEARQSGAAAAAQAPFVPSSARTRVWAAVGPGAALRGFEVGGAAAGSLAELKNGAVVGLGVAAQLLPLQFFDATAGRAWSQLSVEAHYRRAFVSARLQDAPDAAPCTMSDDDLQLRLGWRYKLGGEESLLPSVGVAGGWSQEQTKFECSLPLVSAAWRGVDAQLRIRQPVVKDRFTLELVAGPRFLLPSSGVETPGFSLSGEAWAEVTPVSVLFIRAGARVSRLQASTAQLSATDTRTFIALELGAFL